MDNGAVSFYAELKMETERAFLFTDGIEEFWVPKSQVFAIKNISKNDYEVLVPHWLAEEKGII